jgi:hypothetical protein
MKHSNLSRFIGAAAIVGLAALLTPAASSAQAGISITGGLGLPVGDLGNSSSLGYGLGGRWESNKGPSGWAFRGDVNWESFSGKDGTAIDKLAYLSVGANLVHRSNNSPWYQYGGLGWYRSETELNNGADAEDNNLGAQLGFGTKLSADGRIFAEAGLSTAFTTGGNSVWFPIRVGFRF